MRKSFRISLLLVLALVLTQVTTVAAANSNPGVLPPNSHAFGKSYGEWSNAWWQWIGSLPATSTVFTSNTCETTNQPTKVFFLAGTQGGDGGTRTCTIPTGTPLFFPILNFINGDLLSLVGTSQDEFFRQSIEQALSGPVALSVTVDGVALKNLTSYRTISPAATIALTGTLLADPGTYRVVSGGYYILLHPLSPGTHTIEFSGAQLDTGFKIHVKYLITVVPGHK